MTDLATAADGADILVFVVPHQFIRGLCKQLLGKVKKGAMAVSLIKVSIPAINELHSLKFIAHLGLLSYL